MNPEDRIIDTLESGVPFSEQLPKELFLTLQAARLKMASEALAMTLAQGLDPRLKDYLEGIRRLIENVQGELEGLGRAEDCERAQRNSRKGS